MEIPTIRSSGPDCLGRTVQQKDESSRRARYGRIRPMESQNPISRVLSKVISR